MELFIYSGVGQLPSIDFDCLRISVFILPIDITINFVNLLRFICSIYTLLQAYVRFKGIPVKISTNGNPFHSPNGFLPYLKDDTETVAGYDEIIAYFQSKVKVSSHSSFLSIKTHFPQNFTTC